MTTEVICAIIAAGGAIVSAVIARSVSHSTAKKELERLKLTWDREDVVSSDDDFAEMAFAVARYTQSRRETYDSSARDVISMVASVRARRQDLAAIEDALTRVIDEKRKCQRAQH